MNSRINLFLSLFILLFSFGCLNTVPKFQEGLEQLEAEDVIINVEVTSISDKCYFFVCKNKTDNTWWPFNLLISDSLKEGSCSFYEGKNETDLLEQAELGYTARSFMLGMGPRAWDFSFANLYCNNSLDFMVHWLVSDGKEYELPHPGEATCFLDKDVISVYILYSNSTAVDYLSAGEIASAVDGKGPVILVAEIDFDSSNATVVEQVKTQIRQMRINCPHNGYELGIPEEDPYCLIAVAPKMGDYSGLDKILRDSSGNIDITMNNSIDLVAIGVNSHYFNSSKYGSSCSVAGVFDEAVEFSKYAWFNYSKPVIWPYMLFDSGQSDLEGKCLFSEAEIQSAYHVFFSLAMPSAAGVGVIGAAAYQFYGAGVPTDPLECENCGLMKVEDGKLVPNEYTFSSWFYGCQNYIPKKSALITSFPAQKGGTCNTGFMGDQFADLSTTTGSPLGFYTASYFAQEPLYNCLTCIDSCEEEQIECEVDGCVICDDNPYKIPKRSVGDKCEGFYELDLWASLRGLDKAFVRAITWAETGYSISDPDDAYCKMSFGVHMTANCNILDVLEYIDPSGKCQDSLHEQYESKIEGNTGADLNADGKQLVPTAYEDEFVKPCAVGLMQVHPNYGGYPYLYWEAHDGYDPQAGDLGILYEDSELLQNPPEYLDTVLAEKGYGSDPNNEYRKVAESCSLNGEFNPFDGSQNACVGTWLLASKWNGAENWLNGQYANLGATTEIEKKWLTAFLASYKYVGLAKSTFDGWVSDFDNRKYITESYCSTDGNENVACCYDGKPVENACCNNDDNFIAFVTCCEDYSSSTGDYGFCNVYDVDDEDNALAGEIPDINDIESNAWCEYKEEFECNKVYGKEMLVNSANAAYKMAGFTRLLKYHTLNENCDYGCNDEKYLENINDLLETFD